MPTSSNLLVLDKAVCIKCLAHCQTPDQYSVSKKVLAILSLSTATCVQFSIFPVTMRWATVTVSLDSSGSRSGKVIPSQL